MAKVLCVLYDDPVDGYPKSYARDDIPKLERYPDGQTLPTPSAIDFKPGQLLGSVSGELLSKMKRGAYIVNTARGKICDRDAIVRALKSGQIAGYAGDVWFPQPPPQDHPWRTMPHHGMTPHISGTSLSAQARYAAGTREILEAFLGSKPIRNEYLIVDKGKLAGAGAHSYSAGDATKGSEEAARYDRA